MIWLQVLSLVLFSPLLMVLYFSSFSRKSGSNLNTSVKHTHTNTHLELHGIECVPPIQLIHHFYGLLRTSSVLYSSSSGNIWVNWSSSSTRSRPSGITGWSLKPSFLIANMTSIMYWTLLSIADSWRTFLRRSNIAETARQSRGTQINPSHFFWCCLSAREY